VSGGALGILLFIATLIVMVMIHEAGHMTAARVFGMKVEEYFFGFGPRIFSFRRGETEYGMKAIPAGGYVKIAGMNPYQTVPESELPRTFGAKPAWQRAIVLSAGSATHFVMAALLLTFSFAFLGVPGGATTTLRSVTASAARLNGASGPAEKAGLKAGDRIVSIDGNTIGKWEDLQNYIKARPGRPVSIKVDRAGQLLTFTVTPDQITNADNQPIGRIGVSPKMSQTKEALPAAARDGVKGVGTLIVASVQGVAHLFSPQGIGQVLSSVTGSPKATGGSGGQQPVGLVGGARLAGQAVETGQSQPLVEILALFIVFLGVLNLAPLPPLDGGHLAVLAIEKVRGKPVDPRKVVPVAAFVLSIIVVLAVAVMYADIIHPAANPFQ
jgi:membrane-associated protease RseP (regulator of RpoE activity)